jgi:hypothetical protein
VGVSTPVAVGKTYEPLTHQTYKEMRTREESEKYLARYENDVNGGAKQQVVALIEIMYVLHDIRDLLNKKV